MNKVMEAAIQGHHARGRRVTGPPQLQPKKDFGEDVTCTGYPAQAEILLRDEKTKYQVQPDGSFRKIADQEPGEFNQVLRDSIGKNKKKKR